MTVSAKFHVPVEVAGPTGAVAATRYAGATASGAPASGSFLKGDFVIAQDGKVWVCTAAGSPGTWADVGSGGGSGVTYGTPAIVLGTSAAAGSTDEAIRRDSTIVAFDATVPATQAFGDTAAAGSAAVAARRDHKHAMPATPTSVSGNAGTATALQTARAIDGQSFDGTAAITVIAPGTHAATSKVTPVDADELSLVDSAASNVLKKLLWSNVKATLKTYFDTLYTVSGGAAPIGTTELIYRYTVTGSDKASIDTGADTADAGSNDWTAGDLLEIHLYLRCDEATTGAVFDITLNNDSTGPYDRQTVTGNNASASAGASVNQTKWQLVCPGANSTASFFGSYAMVFPNYAGTVGFKTAEATTNRPATTGAASEVDRHTLAYRSTSAITRFKVIPDTAAKKFIVGSQLLIYKRRSA